MQAPRRGDAPADSRHAESGRCGVSNRFRVGEPLRGWRQVLVTERRTKQDWAPAIQAVVDGHYPTAERLVVVLENRTRHGFGSLSAAVPPDAARRLSRNLPFVWEDAKGEVALEEGIVVVRNLVAGLHGGTARVEGKLMPAGERMAWEGEAHVKGLVLTERIGRPLSFVIPFLRVKKEAGSLRGRADIDLKLAADDTTDAAILRTLAGAGTAHLYDIEAQNSVLLPLLSLRLDKALLREPFRFKDLEVSFDVGNGTIRPKPFELEALPFGINVKEIEVGLDGTVNALVVPGLLPLRIRGTLDDPEVRPAPLAPFR